MRDRELVRRLVVRVAAATAVGALRVVERRPAERVGASDLRVSAVNDECIASGVAECRHHLAFQVGGHPSRRLRRSVPTEQQVQSATAWLEAQLADLVARHG